MSPPESPEPSAAPKHRAAKGLITATALVACFAGAALYLVPKVREFAGQRPRIEPVAFVAAIASYAAFAWASSRQMRACLEALGASTRRPYAVFTMATLGKYLPTKAMVPLLRARLTAAEGASATVVVAALGLEFVIGAVVGTWLGLLLTAHPIFGLPRLAAVAIGVIGPLVLAFAQRPVVVRGVRRAVEVVLARVPGGRRVLPELRPEHAVRAAAWAALSWLFGCASLVLSFHALGGGHGFELPIAGAFALGSMIGYVAFVVPAGLGVREASLIGLLAPHLGAPLVAAAVLAQRVLSTATELIAGGLAALWLAHQQRTAGPSGPKSGP
ncbi:MAG: flippase-like domain-containing protein [Deltaproteobacteria bacterium]|nr:flippase-like domain-containing protein [Deltaproteobacteria bacterium]